MCVLCSFTFTQIELFIYLQKEYFHIATLQLICNPASGSMQLDEINVVVFFRNEEGNCISFLFYCMINVSVDH